MPSSATITAFYSFTANTKARASNVNTNFSNFRGHIIAIDPNTSTAATTETYDIGSTEYRWRTGYFREIDFKSNTSTGQALQIVGDTAAGQGAFLFKHGGNTRARIGGSNGYIDIDTTTSQFDFKVAGTTLASFSNNGLSMRAPGFTTTAAKAQWVSLLITSGAIGVTSGAFTVLAGTSVTIDTIGRPVEVTLGLGNTTTAGFAFSYFTTTGQIYEWVRARLYRNNTLVDNYYLGANDVASTEPTQWNIPNIRLVDTSAPAGSNTYHISIFVRSGLYINYAYTHLYVRELL